MAVGFLDGSDVDVLGAVMEASLDCVIVADSEGRIVRLNRVAERTFGLDREKAVGRSLGETIVPRRHRAAHTAGMTRYMAGGAPRVMGRRVETEARRADGSEFPVELALTEIRAEDGRRLFVASLRDLTEQRAAEAARRASDERLAAFMRNAPIGMYLKDEDGRYVLVNPEMEAVFGRRAEEVLGCAARDLFDAETAAIIEAEDRAVVETGRPRRIEEQLPDNERYGWSLVVRFPVVSGEGGPVQVGGFDIDITGWKTAEAELARSREALHQSEKLNALGSLLAGVSHELNNPLAVVVGQSEMLLDDARGGPLEPAVARVKRAADRCAKIVRTFLAMARQSAPETRAVRLQDTVRDALTLLEYGLRTSDVTVDVRVPDDLPPAWGDPDQIHQVLVNLLVNAQQACEQTETPRRVVISAGRCNEGARVWVEVSDSGPGVPEAVRRRIFEPFFTTKPQGQGTGVGLAFSLGVAQAHGGSLELLDRGPGASFRLSLPLAPAADDVEASEPVRERARGRALVVDDEPDVAETLAAALRRRGFEVDAATGGAEGIARIRDGAYDLIVSDLKMPGVDGPALLSWARSNRPEAVERLGFVTGDTLGARARLPGDAAARPILEKPFTPETLDAFLGRLVPERTP